MYKTLISVIAATLITSVAWCADTTPIGLDQQDAEFAHQAALCGMLEVRVSNMVLKRGISGDDKTFAQLMVDDHTKANKELQAIASKKGITLPTDLDDKHLAMIENVGKANDVTYVERYLEGQIAAHKGVIELFETEAAKGKDVELRAFAAATLPTLKQHLDNAKLLENKH